MKKDVWVGWISSLSEAYNMAIYSFMAPFLAGIMFQEASSWTALFFSYALIMLGACLFYPAGAIYYGALGDKNGRQKTCIYSTLGLAVSTGLMGLIPNALLPDFGWVLFLLLISAQHFFSGGEYHGSIVFSIEHAKTQHNGFISSLSCIFAVFGLILANGFAYLATVTNNLVWVKCTFILGGIGGIISYIMKNYCNETPPFLAAKAEPTKLITFLKLEKRNIAAVTAMLSIFIISYSFIFLFLPLIYADSSFNSLPSLVMYGICLVVAGLLADSCGKDNVIKLGLKLFILAIVPACYFSSHLWLTQLLLIPCAALFIGPVHAWMLEQFKTRHRCRGIFISSAISMSLFLGSTVPISLMLYEIFHQLIICALYPAAVAIAALRLLNSCEKQAAIDVI